MQLWVTNVCGSSADILKKILLQMSRVGKENWSRARARTKTQAPGLYTQTRNVNIDSINGGRVVQIQPEHLLLLVAVF